MAVYRTSGWVPFLVLDESEFQARLPAAISSLVHAVVGLWTRHIICPSHMCGSIPLHAGSDSPRPLMQQYRQYMRPHRPKQNPFHALHRGSHFDAGPEV